MLQPTRSKDLSPYREHQELNDVHMNQYQNISTRKCKIQILLTYTTVIIIIIIRYNRQARWTADKIKQNKHRSYNRTHQQSYKEPEAITTAKIILNASDGDVLHLGIPSFWSTEISSTQRSQPNNCNPTFHLKTETHPSSETLCSYTRRLSHDGGKKKSRTK
jgi:hypothetical protein